MCDELEMRIQSINLWRGIAISITGIILSSSMKSYAQLDSEYKKQQNTDFNNQKWCIESYNNAPYSPHSDLSGDYRYAISNDGRVWLLVYVNSRCSFKYTGTINKTVRRGQDSQIMFKVENGQLVEYSKYRSYEIKRVVVGYRRY